ncbi:hypothetical protein [Capnocytophaga sp.]|uniref:hypothetical protein n=1 Tax=Capnocytophaga sp. TaxID=44737 RepID=UPI0026DBF3A2|nr:hypothetical protein [Capnocytophaga sp.]MDO5105242.1 hypothetical protein [Capnocytophaga sp.]
MTLIQELQNIAKTAEFQQLTQKLADKHQVQLYPNISLQQYNIIADLFKLAEVAVGTAYDYLLKNVDLVTLFMIEPAKNQPQSTDEEEDEDDNVVYLGYSPLQWLVASMELILIEENRLAAFHKAHRWSSAKTTKEKMADYQRVMALLRGEEMLPKKAQKSEKSTPSQKIILESVRQITENQYEAISVLWGKSVTANIESEAFSEKDLLKNLQWIEDNQQKIKDFALNAENFVDGFNAWAEKEIAKKEKAKLFDGTTLTQIADYEDIAKSIFISGLEISFIEGKLDSIEIDLATSPDYFGGHTLSLEINAKKRLIFSGMNG